MTSLSRTVGFKSDGIVHRILKALFAAQVALSGFDGNVSEEKLNLFELASCHSSGGELEQIQFLLGHVSVQTTERYLGCKQRIQSAVNDRIGIEPQL
jgi:hypothetical protein